MRSYVKVRPQERVCNHVAQAKISVTGQAAAILEEIIMAPLTETLSKKRKLARMAAEASIPPPKSKKHKKEKSKKTDKGKSKASSSSESEFNVVHASLIVSIPPVFASNPRAGVEEMLDSMLMRYAFVVFKYIRN